VTPNLAGIRSAEGELTAVTRDDIVGRWPEAERLLDPLLDLPALERRARALAACGEDTGLRQVVERLLDQAEADGEVPPLPGELFDTFPAAPAFIGPYRVIEEIGHGGMSRVFRAIREESAVASPIALKLLDRRPTPAALRRFDRERDTLARLHHPHIARLLDGGITNEGTPYLVMELADGEPIDDDRDRRSVDLAGRLRLFRQVLEAIEFAHARLIVHRDIKPANVFVDQHGAVKLLDFGIAKWLDETGGPALTQTIQRVMTPAHAAREQFRGDPITAATDVYQLGCCSIASSPGGMGVTGAGRDGPPWPAPGVKTKAPALPALSRQVPLSDDRLMVASRWTATPPGAVTIVSHRGGSGLGHPSGPHNSRRARLDRDNWHPTPSPERPSLTAP